VSPNDAVCTDAQRQRFAPRSPPVTLIRQAAKHHRRHPTTTART